MGAFTADDERRLLAIRQEHPVEGEATVGHDFHHASGGGHVGEVIYLARGKEVTPVVIRGAEARREGGHQGSGVLGVDREARTRLHRQQQLTCPHVADEVAEVWTGRRVDGRRHRREPGVHRDGETLDKREGALGHLVTFLCMAPLGRAGLLSTYIFISYLC